MRYVRIDSDGAMEFAPNVENNERLRAIIIADGFLPYECEEMPDQSELSVIESYKLNHRQEEGCIVGYYEKIGADPAKINAEIQRLKAALADTDYKVVKNQELQMVGEACCYDPQELYDEREPLREAIRELEIYLS